MHDSSVVSELEQQLPVVSDYASKPLSFTSLLPTISAEDCPILHKYWSQRYRLFSRYDQGIQMDKGESKRRVRERERASPPYLSMITCQTLPLLITHETNVSVCAHLRIFWLWC